MTAREEIISRVRAALVDRPVPPAVQRNYRTAVTAPQLDAAARLDLLADRLVDYHALVRTVAPVLPGHPGVTGAATARAGAGTLAAGAVAAALAERGVRRMVAPEGLPAAWLARLPPGTEIVRDDPPLTPTALDAVEGVLTGCAVAIAETGTIVLDGDAGQGRRALTLVPDYHLVVIHADQVVATVPEALLHLDPVRPLTWISGPSATSDIELNRVEGVHGPRTLEVILVG